VGRLVRPIFVAFFVLSVVIGASAQRAPSSAQARPAAQSRTTAKAGLKASTTETAGLKASTTVEASIDQKAAFKKAEEDASEQFNALVRPFVTEHCVGCHGYKKQKNGLNLESFETSASLIDDHERWAEVVKKLRAREMPPEEEPQPSEHNRQAVAAWLAKELDHIDQLTPPDPGRVTARRLNRTEYNNTIRDLLGVETHPADDFPQDDAGYGFDNIADVLSLSPVLMEKYVSAAEKVTRQAIFGPPTLKPTLTRLRSDGRRARDARTFPGDYDVTGLSVPNALHSMFRVPVDGEYVVRVGLGGLRPAGSEPITITLWIDDQQADSRVFDLESSARFDDDRQDFGGQAIEFKTHLSAGDRHIAVAIPRIFEGLPARFDGPNPSKRPIPPPKEFKPPPNAPPERVAQLKKTFDDTQETLAKIPMNGVRINTVDIGGPYSQTTGPSAGSRAKIYTCGHLTGVHTAMCARRILTNLANRAFRRPVLPREMDGYVALAKRAQEQEKSFDEGIAVGIQALLVSPDFLFRIEHDPPVAAALRPGSAQSAAHHRISQHELATRLSYFLWSSMPDAQLRLAADMGTLRNPSVLAAQVKRMLKDPKARALAENFGAQWLQFRALESVSRDKDRYPEFEDYLRLSMRRETELFIDDIIRNDRKVLDFIDGRYSFLNERLARHYGIPNVTGPEFRRVDLSDTPRGGVLTQASVLTVSSYATRTSPVLRGRWVLDNLLDAPPPEPPADVPNLDESKIGSAASLREQLEQHRKDPTCAACHRRMDPLGFGLENFDAVGAWRTVDGKFPIDATGVLPDGRKFNGPDELRAILKADHQAFEHCLTSKLLTYALGRGLERYDKRTVSAIVSRLPEREYRFSGLILEIVKSLPFQSRNTVSTP
jgi:mono/diheme cytochrome c family protein